MCLVNYSDVAVFSVNLMNRQSQYHQQTSSKLKEPEYVKSVGGHVCGHSSASHYCTDSGSKSAAW